MTTGSSEIYRCEVCGNLVEVLHPAAGQLVCCGVPMKRLEADSVDAVREKHVPVVENAGRGTLVKVGSAPHPMIPEHFIEWIEILDGPRVERHHLEPGDAPQARFEAAAHAGATVRAYCNLHGLWKN